MNLFNNIIESFSEKNDQKKNTTFKTKDYVPHIFLIIILIICVIVGLIYIDEITELLGLSKSNKEEYFNVMSYNKNH
tara:strand:- start:3024 stop:3254 length:231 start_codon:yes stop_codon:yes gene_type:complete